MFRVIVMCEGEEPTEFEFGRTQRIRFGRAAQNDIVLHPSYVSREHGEFVRVEDQWFVIDHGSRVGLTIIRGGGGQASSHLPGKTHEKLEGGEIIRILGTTMQVELKPQDDFWDPETGGDSTQIFGAAPLSSSHLLDEIPPARGDGREGAQLLQILILAKDLNRLDDLDDVLDRIGRAVFDSLPAATHFSICVPSRGGLYLPRFGVGRHEGELRRGDITVAQVALQSAIDRQTGLLFGPSTYETDASSSSEPGLPTSMAVPLLGSRGSVGVMQIDSRSGGTPFSVDDLDFVTTLASSAAFAVERAELQSDLQRVFEGFVDASVTAIEARDPTTSGHSRRVSGFTVSLATAVSRHETGRLGPYRFTEQQLHELDYAALLHDFGKIGVRECVLVKANRLFPEQFERIVARFRLVREAFHGQLLTRALRGDAGLPAGADPLGWVEGELAQLTQLLEEDLEFLQAVNLSGALDAHQIARVQLISTRTVLATGGDRLRLLDAEELEALSIPSGTLTPNQLAEIRDHARQSYRVLRRIRWPAPLARIPEFVHAHHEKLDGSGYPRGIEASEIPMQARILTVCDIFDAVTASDRPYRNALSPERGLDLLRSESRSGKIDANLVEVFIQARVWEPKS